MSQHDILQVIQMIYDCATDQSLWPETLDRIAAVTGSASCTLVVKQIEKLAGRSGFPYEIQASSRLFRESPFLADYLEKFKETEEKEMHNLLKLNRLQVLPDELAGVHDIAAREYRKNKFGIDRRIALRLDDNKCWAEFVLFQLDVKNKSIPLKSIETCNLLAPHLAKSVSLRRSFAELKYRYQAVLSALGMIRCGVCIVNRRGRVIVANQTAHELLDSNAGIKIDNNDTLRFSIAEKNDQFRLAVASVVDSTKGLKGEVEHRIYSNDVLDSRNRIMLEISPVSELDDELNEGNEFACILLILTNPNVSVTTHRLAAAYKLSPAEADVCSLLGGGYQLSEIADIRNVSLETIKTQVKSLYTKTSTANRLELLKLAYAISPPIISAI